MPSYLRPDNYQVYQQPLYQPNFDLLSRVTQADQYKYNTAIRNIASTYTQAMGLNVQSKYNTDRLASMMNDATEQLKKGVTLDFSKSENEAKMENVFNPIFTDRDILTETAATKMHGSEQQKMLSWRESKNKDDNDKFSMANYKWMMRPAQQLQNATTREDMLNAAGEMKNKIAFASQNTISKLFDRAKKDDLKFEFDQVNGNYIIKNKFGDRSIPSLKEYAMMNMDDDDRFQLQIHAENAINDLKDRGLDSKAIAQQLYDADAKKSSNDLDYLNSQMGSYAQSVAELKDRAAKNNGLVPSDDAKLSQLNGELIPALQKQIDEQKKDVDSFKNNKRKDSEGKDLFSDYEKNPVDLLTKYAAGTLVNSWAHTYADNKHEFTFTADPIALKMMDIQEKAMDKAAKDGKEPKLTESEQKLKELNTIRTVGNSPFANSLVGNVFNAVATIKNDAVKEQEKKTFDIASYYGSHTLGINDSQSFDKFLNIAKSNPNEVLNYKDHSDILNAFKQSPLYSKVNLEGKKMGDLYREVYVNALKDQDKEINAGTDKGLVYLQAKTDFDKAKMTEDAVKAIENDPRTAIGNISKYKDLLNDNGDILDEQEYVDKQMTSQGWTKAHAANVYVKNTHKYPGIESDLPLDVGVGAGVWNAVTDVMNTQYAKNSDVSALHKQYQDAMPQLHNKLELLKKDERVKRLVYDQNYPILAANADKNIQGETAEKVFENVYNSAALTSDGTAIKNLDVLMKDTGLSKDDAIQYLKTLTSKKNDLERVEATGYAPDGKLPYNFKFNSNAYDDITKSMSSDEKKKMSKFITNLKSEGVTIGNDKDAGMGVIRENGIEKLLDANGFYQFKSDSTGGFGFTLRKVNINGNNVIEWTLNSKEAKKDDNGQILLQDGKYQFTDKAQSNILTSMSPDEAYRFLLKTVYDKYSQHVKESRVIR